MAGSVLTYVVRRIGDFIIEEAIFLRDVKEEVDRLHAELRRMECFLEDADEKREQDKRVGNWVRDVREVAYQAEDLIESFILKVKMRRQWRRGYNVRSMLCACVPCELITRHNFGTDIQLLRVRIDDIKESRQTYGIADLGAGRGEKNYVDERVQRRRRANLHASDSDVVGFEDEKKIVLKLLFSDSVKRRSVISIAGMGGLGKTTLAKEVYKDCQIKSHFGFCAWIDVSQKYKDLELLQDLVQQISRIEREELGKMTRKDLEVKLDQSLQAERYLIVMDDVWDNEVWKIVGPHLPDIGNGSRVLITTRSLDVARSADSSTPPHEKRFLNEQESWELFSKKAFPYEDARSVCSGEFEEICKEMTGKCRGLPLALVVLGGLLSKKERRVIVWRSIAESIVWQHDEEGQLCMEILALSYADLPHHLKWCFLYFSAFPEDFEIEVQKLIRLWIAEGFVKDRAGATLEQSAERYLEELVQRCLVQVAAWYDIGTERCRMHDLLHELSISQAKEVGFFYCYRKPQDSVLPYSSLRRLSLHQGVEEYISQRHSTPRLRTLLGFNFEGSPMGFPLNGLKMIRVIDLEGGPIELLPKQVGDLIHLRYLGLKKTRIKSLPRSVVKLSHLQVLDIKGTRIAQIPGGVWTIKALRHVIIPDAVEPQRIPGSLSSLQVLETAKAGDWINSHLHSLTNLQTLRITGIRGSYHQVLSASLPMFSRLTTLELAGESIPASLLTLSSLEYLHTMGLLGQMESPLQSQAVSYQWPSNLCNLTLWDSGLVQDPLPSLGKLSDLRVLLLLRNSYRGTEMACPYDGFPKLQTMRLEYLGELEQWTVDDGAMPCLRTLMINSCKKLKTLPQGLKGLASLKEFTLLNMPSEFYSRVKKEEGDDWEKIAHIPSITVNRQKIT
ncbi:unnamed protein product [Spirodela intermedia]|uniref:Uncharacterized protein n=1 Tax=Spirodela intermedia TaxID=51605 RepID=A0A7I8JKY0_SPIIN|nr:unnamed protein product [Spirodela intermedia]CAA6670809.1 unnamed protein product [Spirodela intermedia]